MLLSTNSKKKTEDYIIEILHSSTHTGPTLLDEVRKKKSKLPKETFYRVLRKLLNQEIITKNKNSYGLNRHWLQRIYGFSRTNIEKKETTDTDHILSFQEGDKIRYSFKNPNHMGIYWAHTYDMIFDNHDPKIPILIFHPHEWLIHTRTEAESFFLSRPNNDKKLVWFAIGSKDSLDRKFKNDWESKYIQVGLGINIGLKDNEYLNVVGDFIFKITLSKKFSTDLNNFFANNTEVNKNNIDELKSICNRNDSVKMLFTKSNKEADKYRAKFKKYFYKAI
jgi:Fe2+ or Zn2+ uptake regulation protein